MSPRWAAVGVARLYFYAQETHRRPHVDVRGPGWRFAVALDDLEVLAVSGRVPRRVQREVVQFLRVHQAEAVAAFEARLRHEPLRTLDEQEGDDD